MTHPLGDEKDVLQELAEQARRLSVAAPLATNRTLTVDEIIRTRDTVKAFMRTHKVSLSDLSRQMGGGYSTSTLSVWLNWDGKKDLGKSTEKITRGLNQWMETFLKSKAVPKIEGWIEIGVALKMMALIKNTIESRTIGSIYADAGRGKTMTLNAAHKTFPQSLLIRVTNATQNDRGLAKAIVYALRIKAQRTFFAAEQSIVEHLSGSNRPLMVDEAHQLDASGFEFLRCIHDTCRIPIIIAGTREMDNHIRDTGRSYGQFVSRLCLQYDPMDDMNNNPKNTGKNKRLCHSVDDIRKLWETPKVRFTLDAIMRLVQIANVECMGGLRTCDQIVKLAVKLEETKEIRVLTIDRVVKMMHGITSSKMLIQKANAITPLKTA